MSKHQSDKDLISDCVFQTNDKALVEPLVNSFTVLSDDILHEWQTVRLNYAEDSEVVFNSRRVFHGRGKMYPGLEWCCIDFFQPVILVTLFQAPPVNWESDLIALLTTVMQELNAVLPDNVKFVEHVLLQRRYLERSPIEALIGEVPEKAFAFRNGEKYHLSFTQQNVGFFLDIEPARQWLEDHAKFANVLNLFSYTCTFSVVARSAGADKVVNIDLSKKSLAIGQANHQINQCGSKGVSFLGHDILKSWGKLKKHGPYDIVIIDPPSFQKGSFIATKDYQKVLRKMDVLVAEGGRFLACLNAPEIPEGEFISLIQSHAEGFQLEKRLDPNPTFPEREDGKGLKMLVFQRS